MSKLAKLQVVVLALCTLSLLIASSRYKREIATRAEVTTPGYSIIRIETDKDVYLVGEQVQFRLYQKNIALEPIHGGVGTITKRILNSDGEIVHGPLIIDIRWVSDFMLEPGQEVELNGVLVPWQQRNNQGEQVPTGTYTFMLKIDGQPSELTVAIVER